MYDQLPRVYGGCCLPYMVGEVAWCFSIKERPLFWTVLFMYMYNLHVRTLFSHAL